MSQDDKKTGEIGQHVIDAFSMMWDLHPAPVMLTKADRTIVAVNQAAKAAGILPQLKCFTLCGPDRPCATCEANLALRDKAARRIRLYVEQYGRFMDSYWTPVAGVPGLFIHYANDITECVREELLRSGSTC